MFKLFLQKPTGKKGKFLTSSDERLSLELPTIYNVQDIRATLIICHDTVDHSGLYRDLANALVKEGVAVFTQVMRGWGLSNRRVYMNGMTLKRLWRMRINPMRRTRTAEVCYGEKSFYIGKVDW